jgi:arylsulfatase A-like enzyme
VPLVRGQRDSWPEEVLVQISEAQVGRAVRTQRWKYCVVAPDKDPVNDAGSERYQESALYDLLADPYELNNLIGLESHREVADVMGERLKRRMAEAGEPAPQIVSADPRPSGQKRVTTDEAWT